MSISDKQLLCIAAISSVAAIYSAELEQGVDYANFRFCSLGIKLLRPDGSIATGYETIQAAKWTWLRESVNPADITFAGCVRWYIRARTFSPCGATAEEVFNVLRGHCYE